MKELIVISGKGGTGKTSLVASFASLAQRAVVTDCDVDAADLHLVLQSQIQQCADFIGGSKSGSICRRINGFRPARFSSRGRVGDAAGHPGDAGRE